MVWCGIGAERVKGDDLASYLFYEISWLHTLQCSKMFDDIVEVGTRTENGVCLS